jgi:hypothetical protein
MAISQLASSFAKASSRSQREFIKVSDEFNKSHFCYEKIPCMPQKNVAGMVYAIENTNLSSMPKVVIFHVLYAISVRCSWMLLVGPTYQW